MAKDAELKEEKKKKRKSEAADLGDVSVSEEKKAKKEKRKSVAGEEERVSLGCGLVEDMLGLEVKR